MCSVSVRGVIGVHFVDKNLLKGKRMIQTIGIGIQDIEKYEREISFMRTRQILSVNGVRVG